MPKKSARTSDQYQQLAEKLDPSKLRDQTVQKLIARHQAGHTLSEAQHKLIEDWRARRLEAAPSTETSQTPAAWVGSARELSAILGCHEKSIPRWLREYQKEYPNLKRSNGGYNVAVWQKLFAEHGLGAAEASAGDQAPKLATIKLDQEVEKLHRLRRENRIEDGKFIPLEHAARVLQDAHEHLKNLSRETWEEQMPPQLAGLTSSAIRALARQANDRLCSAMQDWAAKLQVKK